MVKIDQNSVMYFIDFSKLFMLEFLNFYKMTWRLFSKVEKSLYDELFAVCLSFYKQ